MREVRAAVGQDEQALLAVDIATWSASVSPAPPPGPGSSFFDKRTRHEDVLVAVSDSRVVGYVKLHQSIPLASHDHVLEINGLAVDPAWQGRGVGRHLLDAAKREVEHRGARKLSLRVLSPNDRARRLYESCGFAVEGILKGEFVLEGRLVDDILMAWHR